MFKHLSFLLYRPRSPALLLISEHNCSLLAEFFSAALKQIEAILCSDLDGACLADHPSWRNVRVEVSSEQQIPLPASNSPAAKQMRVVAGLVIFGKALCKYIFRSTYLIRVSDVLSILVLPSKRRDFELGLKRVSDDICHGWSQVQRLEAKVSPSFSFEFPDDWQPFPPPGSQPSAKPGSSPSTQLPTQAKKSEPQSQQQLTTRPESLTDEEFKEIIWPAFLVVNPEQAQDTGDINPGLLIHHGYILTKEQAKEAEQERNAEEEASRRARKNARQIIGGDKLIQRKRRDSRFSSLLLKEARGITDI